MLLHQFLLYITIFVFDKVSKATCDDKGTLAFVIDDTMSMADDIDQVKSGAKEIIDIVKNDKTSQFKNIILVTFNDPDVLFRVNTTSYEEFKASLDSISVHDGDDCPEFSLTGIELALQNSSPGSTLFVYTDASAKDHALLTQVRGLSQRKQSQVVFVLTGDCRRWYGDDDVGYIAYYNIAAASAGQVFRLNNKKEVGAVNNYIKETIKGQRTVLTSKLIPPSTMTAVTFTVDDKTEYAIISASGLDVILKLDSSDVTREQITWIQNVKVLKLTNIKPGQYTAWVKGGTITSAVVFGRTDFMFQHGFSTVVPKSLKDTSKQPIGGSKSYLSISTTDPEHSVNINAVQILDMNERVIQEVPLKKTGDNFYRTDPFVSPEKLFKIAVKGTSVSSGRVITRISKTAIEPQKPEPPKSKAAEATIIEGNSVTVEYNSALRLACRVTAYPEPHITWTDSKGNLIPSKTYPVEPPYVYVNYMEKSGLKQTEKYHCHAKNNLGPPASSDISVTVKSPFQVQEHVQDVKNVEYGKECALRCNIKSHLPMRITWKLVVGIIKKHDPIRNSNQYSMSPDGTELKIKRMDKDLAGKYVCVAQLQGDESVKISYETNVKVTGLVKPEIDKNINLVKIFEKTNVDLNCKLLNGSPTPEITWQFNGVNTNKRGEVLSLKNVGFHNSGQYTCSAKNIEGSDRHDIRLTVEAINKVPQATVSEGATTSVPYNSTLSLTCRVTAYPEPHITWTDSKGNLIPSKTSPVNLPYEYISYAQLPPLTRSEKYYCRAANSPIIRPNTANIDVNVQPAFTVHEHLPDISNVEYGKESTLHCNIKSHLPMQIKWIFVIGKPEKHISIESMGTYSVSPDGTELKIKRIDKSLAGKYLCVAQLEGDKSVKISYETTVQIADIAKPEIEKNMNLVKPFEKADVDLHCKLLKGNPKPEITWQFNGVNTDRRGEVLSLKNIGFHNSGQYTCLANNIEGSDRHIIQLIVQEINKVPQATISEGAATSVLYKSTLPLTCRVTAYPEPHITWTDSKGNVIPSKTSPVNLPYEYINYVQLPSLTTSERYYCRAVNSLVTGPATANIAVTVQPAFSVHEHVQDVTNVEYGKEITLHCNITSHLRVRRNWVLVAGKPEKYMTIKNSGQYSISADGTELKIKRMDKDLAGKYVCVAQLQGDESVKISYETNVKVTGLVKPEIDKNINLVKIFEKTNVDLNCKLLNGSPTPEITWQFNGVNTNKRGEVLSLKNVGFHNSGQYTCSAKNVEGSDRHDIRLTVEAINKVPQATVSEGATTSVPYNSTLSLTCRVTAYPEPHITWTDSKGNLIPSKTSPVNLPYEYISYAQLPPLTRSEKYYCRAANSPIIRPNTANIDVNVQPAFTVHEHLPDISNVEYGKESTLHCNIKSHLPMQIKWIFVIGKPEKHISIESMGTYSVSPDGTELKIKRIDKSLAGKYLCVAQLEGDKSVKISYETTVQIADIAKPEIEKNMNLVKPFEKADVDLHCKLLKGNPKPEITWQFNGVNTDRRGEVLSLKNIGFHNSGQYTCLANNIEGSDRHIIQLIVQEINKVPQATISEGAATSVLYKSTLPLTCRVTAYPEPHITWTDSKGNVIPSKTSPVNLPYEYINYVQLPSLTTSERYYCRAVNSLVTGPATANIAVTVQPAFSVHEHVQDVTNVEYGKESTLHCNITSHLRVRRNWVLVAGKPEKYMTIKNSGQYSISADGTELKLKHMDKSLAGKYVCVAQLVGDESVKISFETNVTVIGLVKPEIDKSTITVKKNEKTDVDLNCKLLKGNPKPEVTWQFNGVDTNRRGEVLSLKNVGFYNSGLYACLANNVEGSDRHVIQLTVEAINKVPQATISEGAATSVPYFSSLPLTCKVTAYPKPHITWTDSKGNLIPSMTSPVNLPYEYISYVQLSSLTKSEEYHCRAINSLVTRPAAANIAVNVQPAFNVHEHLKDVTNIEYGTGSKLHCKITSHLPMRMSWMAVVGKPAKLKPIESTGQYSISADGTELKIKRMDKSLAGKYVCMAELKGDKGVNVKYQTQVNVVGLVKPVIEKKKIVEKAFQKTDVNLHCKVLKGNPKPEVTWQFKGVEGNRLMKSGEFLKLDNVNFGSSGRYECVAKNIEGSDQHIIEVIVEGPPEIIMNQTDYKAVVGDIALRLPCVVEGNPKASVSWQINEIAVVISKKYYIKDGTLTIHNPLESDIGNYTCIAENKYGVDKKTIDVLVTPELISFGEDSKKMYIIMGTSAQVKCPGKYKGSDSLRWFKNECPTKIIASYVDISNASFEHDGNYTCRVSNDLGSVSSTIDVDVGYPPRFKSEKYDKSIKWPEDDYSLTCAVDSKPKENFTWYLNGVEMKDKTAQYDDILEISDWGEYTCKATNVHGSTKRSFDVYSDDCIIDRSWKPNVNTPLLLDEYYWPIIEAKQQFLSLQSKEKFTLSCGSNSKNPNFFSKIPGKNVIEAICDREDKFIAEGKTFKLSDLSCKENIMPDFTRTGVKCLNDNTEIIHIGFNIKDNKFTDAYEICYDTMKRMPLYAKTELLNSNDFYDGPEDKWYKLDEFGEDKSEKYKCMTRLRKDYKLRNDSECCYAKSQLVNPIDLFYGPSQTATFIDHLNSIPILSSLCDKIENWQAVENGVRSYLVRTQGLVVWSGVSHFMDIDGLSVPRYLWKVVNEDTDTIETSTAVVYVNHKEPNGKDKLCTDICDELEWMDAPYTSIYCCHFNDFVKAFKLPKEIFSD